MRIERKSARRGQRRRSRASHAVVVAYLALFVALGGSGYAASQIKGSQLANRSVSAKKIKKGTLTGTEVKNGSLRAGDFKGGELPAGPRGPAGPAGEAGSALAYGYVDENAALDPAQSKNVAGVRLGSPTDDPPTPFSGWLCFDLATGPAKNVLASPAKVGFYTDSVLEWRALGGSVTAGSNYCPAGYRDAMVIVMRNYIGSIQYVNFPMFVAFN